ncbi:TPA: hypothetical protein DIV55_03500 [Patescibacteria group bacterium]|uniref:ABC transporter related protein n=1 Tax=Candidatus Gottesmanbacteria bacterium GW2011_GWA1_43_11 TaxID=1618436 RepID=A0A0G1EQY2_9BACT|nr:MAG: ABC transporter related protein [Candidatus Gottesmanbacteria bacterium GW2011_GWA1_43_11]HCS78785.1 hypothetical protein [Patescibacteria group bacterium]
MHAAIEVHHVSKKYILTREGRFLTIRDKIGNLLKSPWGKLRSQKKYITTHEFWALKDIHFTARFGESLGLIGKNGAGKSTLLKILGGIIYPSVGKVKLECLPHALMDVGAGFHSDLTGRENIFLAGAIMGMKRTTIEKKVNEIIDFAEIGSFIDTQVKYYSSGMFVRLAFSVAVQSDPKILLIDEAFSMGDQGFQEKSLAKMTQIIKEGQRTVVSASHNLELVKRLCTRVLWLDQGKVVKDGRPEDVISAYLQSYN